jgi:malic enzyme
MLGRRPGNNAFVFPGIGLGSIVGEVTEVSDEIFMTAARTLAASITPDRLEAGALYPDPSRMREVSRRIAIAVVREAKTERVGRSLHDEDIEKAVDEFMWYPDYPQYTAGP